jgi:hypothetical protein
MDNGLIFPYPRKFAHADLGDAKAVNRDPFGVNGDRPDRSDCRQAGGVTQEGSCTGRWSSRGKGVGRRAGKSACHGPET